MIIIIIVIIIMIRLVYNSHHMSERPHYTLEYDKNFFKRDFILCFLGWFDKGNEYCSRNSSSHQNWKILLKNNNMGKYTIRCVGFLVVRTLMSLCPLHNICSTPKQTYAPSPLLPWHIAFAWPPIFPILPGESSRKRKSPIFELTYFQTLKKLLIASGL